MIKKGLSLLRGILSPSITWKGNYGSWKEAKAASKGYNDDLIFNKVKSAALEVRDKEDSFERDGFVFNRITVNPFFLSAVYRIKAKEKKATLNVLDFGGSLGSVYKQHKKYLDLFSSIKWSVIEQHKFVEIGNTNFKHNNLFFYSKISEFTVEQGTPDLILISSTLQYLEAPYSILKELIALGSKYLIMI